VQRAAETDATVARVLLEVAGLLRPPSALFRPALLVRVLALRRNGDPPDPTHRTSTDATMRALGR
jgi:hypothetical protein